MAHLFKALKFMVCKSEKTVKRWHSKICRKNPNYGIRRLHWALSGQVGSDRMMEITAHKLIIYNKAQQMLKLQCDLNFPWEQQRYTCINIYKGLLALESHKRHYITDPSLKTIIQSCLLHIILITGTMVEKRTTDVNCRLNCIIITDRTSETCWHTLPFYGNGNAHLHAKKI